VSNNERADNLFLFLKGRFLKKSNVYKSYPVIEIKWKQ